MGLRCKGLGSRSVMLMSQPTGHSMDTKVRKIMSWVLLCHGNLWFSMYAPKNIIYISCETGNTFDLKLISTGEDGIEEMIEELNANKILYAFIKGKICQIWMQN